MFVNFFQSDSETVVNSSWTSEESGFSSEVCNTLNENVKTLLLSNLIYKKKFNVIK